MSQTPIQFPVATSLFPHLFSRLSKAGKSYYLYFQWWGWGYFFSQEAPVSGTQCSLVLSWTGSQQTVERGHCVVGTHKAASSIASRYKFPMKRKENLFFRCSPTPCMWSNPANWAVVPWTGICEVTRWLHVKDLVSRNWALKFFFDNQTRPGVSSGFTDWGEPQTICPWVFSFCPCHLPAGCGSHKSPGYSFAFLVSKDASAVLCHFAITNLMPKWYSQGWHSLVMTLSA